MKKKRFLLVAVGLACIIALTAIPLSGCPGKTYEWTFGQIFTEGTIRYDQSVDLVERIHEAFEGRITVNHFPGDLLGDYAVQATNTATGAQDMYYGAPTEENSPKWAISATPYVVKDWDSAEDFYGPGGPMHEVYEQVANESNWELLGGSPEGFTGLISKVQFDPMPGPKGIKCRVYAVESAKSMAQAVGFETITMPWSEIHSALMLGTIDAAWGPTGADDYLLFADAADYAYFYNFNFGYLIAVMNLDLFNSLDASDQQLLKDVGAEWENDWWPLYRADQEQRFQQVRQAMTVIDLTPEQLTANCEAVRAVTWPEVFEPLLGKEFMDQIRDQAAPC
jgi:TRAP-type C4-dicarboxylate transport system substrate-binding protein